MNFVLEDSLSLKDSDQDKDSSLTRTLTQSWTWIGSIHGSDWIRLGAGKLDACPTRALTGRTRRTRGARIVVRAAGGRKDLPVSTARTHLP